MNTLTENQSLFKKLDDSGYEQTRFYDYFLYAVCHNKTKNLNLSNNDFTYLMENSDFHRTLSGWNSIMLVFSKNARENLNFSPSQIDYLIKNSNLKMSTKNGWTPLSLALDYNKLEKLNLSHEQFDYLINNSDLNVNTLGENSYSPFHLAIRSNVSRNLNLSSKQIDTLLRGADLKGYTEKGWDALMTMFDNNLSQNLNFSNEQFDFAIKRSNLYRHTADNWNALSIAIINNKEKNLNLTSHQFDYLIRKSNLKLNISNNVSPLMLALNQFKNDGLPLNAYQFDYFIKNSDLSATDKNNYNALKIALNHYLQPNNTIPFELEEWEYLINKSPIIDNILSLLLENTYKHNIFRQLSDKTWGYAFRTGNLNSIISFQNKEYTILEFIDLFEDSLFRTSLKTLYNDSLASSNLDNQFLKIFQEKINNFIGLSNVKDEFHNLINIANFNEKHNKKLPMPMKYIFVGNHGIGKQMIANKLSELYSSLEIISNNEHFSIFNDFFEYNKNIEEHSNTTIYFHFDVSKEYKEEVELKMIEKLENIPNSLFILAISPSQLVDLQVKYPKLFSLFPKIIRFDDYTSDDLFNITAQLAEEQNLTFNDHAKNQLIEYYNYCRKNKAILYSNFYLAQNTLTTIIENHTRQIKEATYHDDFIITEQSIPYFKQENLDLSNVLAELNEMVGLDHVKKTITEYAALTMANKRRGVDIHTNMHLVFLGNPGTGKTVVARLIGKIYKALGILTDGHVIETDRSGLVEKWVGHTAKKTELMVKKAMGGVLFIDEAYSLSVNSENDFGKEAIETLLKLMEDHRKDFAVIVAGYPDNMITFLESNPGLKSRFTKNVDFKDYNLDELLEILESICRKEHFIYDNDFLEAAKNYLIRKNNLNLHHDVYENKPIGFLQPDNSKKTTQYYTATLQPNKHFGNAREVRTLFEKVLEKQAVRLMNNPANDIWILRKEDVEKVEIY